MPETIGLDIGSHSIKLVGLKMTSKGPFLTCLGMKEIPPGKDKEDMKTASETLRIPCQRSWSQNQKGEFSRFGFGSSGQANLRSFTPKG